MPINQGVTLDRVETARKRLYQVQQKYGFLTHPKVVEQSKKLDDLLNLYKPYSSQTAAHERKQAERII
ncbi:aspartyl-phosphate phosphatase Spo0E family protein [Paenibacillus donghaensis]|uniref:Aspartyl-phosphate phosphatase Spo0E family protein n=1 Tax=Paenibacillus donghaensis TaxID=414771 RepID=A0A2Z2K8C9_9BACL|nr:aspartyl-phosphate phosphatase Spo0E family protein [Paenibacillus donghaensis]ASA21487.1 hypothetical protein B9T62_12275 [Paenibacillus donghaensis]